MITYECHCVEGEPPQLRKVISVGEESFYTSLVPENADELDDVSDELIYNHIEHLISHMKFLAAGIELHPQSKAPLEPYPLKNLPEFFQYGDTASKWWGVLWKRSQSEDEQIASESVQLTDAMHDSMHESGDSHYHLHFEELTIYAPDGAQEHTHDPETGEPVYV